MAAITPGQRRIDHTRMAATKQGALCSRCFAAVGCEGVLASAVPDPRQSGHTPVGSRTLDRDAPSRLGLCEASAEARLPISRQVPRCRHERGRAMPSRFTRACSVGRCRPRRAAAPAGQPSTPRASWSGRRRWSRSASLGEAGVIVSERNSVFGSETRDRASARCRRSL